MSVRFQGQTVLVTGASEGIGQALVKELDGRVGHFILVSRRRDALTELAEALRTPSSVIPCDLSTQEGPDDLLKSLSGVSVDVLINNAGVSVGGRFEDRSIDEVLAMIRLNVEAPTRLIHALLPGWRERGRGAVLNVGSVAGLLPCPGMSAYGATKSYINSFSQALAGELHRSGIQVSCLAPGSTRTGFFRRARIDESKLTKHFQSAESVAREGVRALERGRILHISGLPNRLVDRLIRFSPRVLVRHIAGRVLRPLSSGDAVLEK